jgi:hypothetical protein
VAVDRRERLTATAPEPRWGRLIAQSPPVHAGGLGLPSRLPRSVNASTAGWLARVECNRCMTRASLPLDAIRRPRDTPIWKLEVSLKCRSCRKGRWAPPVRVSKKDERARMVRDDLG